MIESSQFDEIMNLLCSENQNDVDLGLGIVVNQIDNLTDWQIHWIWMNGSQDICYALKYKYGIWERIYGSVTEIIRKNRNEY